MAGEWDATLEEWITQEGMCSAGGMAQVTDGAFYAAAPAAEEAGWAKIFAPAASHKVLQEDGVTEKDESVDESWQLKQLIETSKKPYGGMFFGGEAYKVVQVDKDFEMGESSYWWCFCSKPKGGVHLVSTGSQVVAGFYSEEKGQSSGNCKKTVLAFAEYLKGIGY